MCRNMQHLLIVAEGQYFGEVGEREGGRFLGNSVRTIEHSQSSTSSYVEVAMEHTCIEIGRTPIWSGRETQ